MPRDTCRGTRDDGEPCGSPVVGPDGFCPAHGEDGSEKMRKIGRKGAQATARKLQRGGLGEDELPPLESHAAAETWCDAVGRAAVTGRIGHNEARAALRAVKEWRESRGEGEMSERLEALTDALAEWKRTGDPAPVLEIVG